MGGHSISGFACSSAAFEQATDMTIEDRILDIVARGGRVDRAKLTPDATLESLGIASIDIIDILMMLEEELDVYVPVDGDWSKVGNIGELVATLAKRVDQNKVN